MKQNDLTCDNTSSNTNANIEQMRLQKYLALCGVASRRKSEEIIVSGSVSVNGITVTELGTKIAFNASQNKALDEVCVDGIIVLPENVKRYVLLNKPVGYVCSLDDEQGRDTAASLVASRYAERLYNVGRLDMYSSGLLIFTNDGGFAAAVSHPSSQIEKEYEVCTNINIPDTLLEKFSKGVRIEEVFYRAEKIEKKTPHIVNITLVEGKNREIRRVFTAFDVPITGLRRIRIGEIMLEDLPLGDMRELTKNEIQSLIKTKKHLPPRN